MNDAELIKRSYEAIERASKRPAKELLQQFIDAGIIDEQGQVLLSWDAFLAVIAVKRNGKNRIDAFRCLKSIPNMPGLMEIDVTRESMAQYVGEEGKRVIIARLNEKQQRWKEGEEVHLTTKGYLRTDANDIAEDNLGELPEFQTVRSKL